jgi:hypothetical protein
MLGSARRGEGTSASEGALRGCAFSGTGLRELPLGDVVGILEAWDRKAEKEGTWTWDREGFLRRYCCSLTGWKDGSLLWLALG